MKVNKLICPNCGARLNPQKMTENDVGEMVVFCDYCGQTVSLDLGIHRESRTENININRNSRDVHVDEAEVIRAKNDRTKLKAIILGIIIGGAVLIAGSVINRISNPHSTVELVHENAVVVDNSEQIYAQFVEVIVGEAKREALLIIDEQELAATALIEQSGAFNWKVFSKNQSATYYGVAQYTVDLSKVSKDNINFDKSSNTITVYVPKPELHAVIFDPEKTVFGDVKKGLLAFGEINLTAEETSALEEEALKLLTETAKQSNQLDKAETLARYSVRELFETAAESIEPKIKVKVELKG